MKRALTIALLTFCILLFFAFGGHRIADWFSGAQDELGSTAGDASSGAPWKPAQHTERMTIQTSQASVSRKETESAVSDAGLFNELVSLPAETMLALLAALRTGAEEPTELELNEGRIRFIDSFESQLTKKSELGFQAGDYLVSLDGSRVESLEALVHSVDLIVRRIENGERNFFDITLLRDAKAIHIRVTLKE